MGFRVGIGWRWRSACAAVGVIWLWSLHTFIGRSHACRLTRNLQQCSRAEKNMCTLTHMPICKSHKLLKQLVQPGICYKTIPRAAKTVSHQEQIFQARKCQPGKNTPELASSAPSSMIAGIAQVSVTTPDLPLAPKLKTFGTVTYGVMAPRPQMLGLGLCLHPPSLS